RAPCRATRSHLRARRESWWRVIRVRYTAWDGSQTVQLDPDRLFEKLAEALSLTDDVQRALEWMLRQGLELDGVRIMGLDEALEQLRKEMRQRFQKWNLDEALNEPQERLNDILRRERQALDEKLAPQDPTLARERRAMLDDLPESLSGAIERIAQQYRFTDESAERDFRELLEELDNIR